MQHPGLDRGSPVPLFLQIRQALLSEIRSWADPAERFPSDQELSERFGVSKMTVRQAMDELVDTGLLSRQRGRGTFVTDKAYVERLAGSLDIDQHYASAGVATRSRVLMHALQDADEADLIAFQDPALRSVLVIQRIRYANGVPIALDARRIPEAVGAKAGLDADRAAGSIVGMLRSRVGLSRAKWRVSALPADADLALHLSIAPGAPVLRRDMTYLDRRGLPVLTGQTWQRGDLVSCAFELPLDDDAGVDMTAIRKS
jgi:GntR family transcriptional regulator